LNAHEERHGVHRARSPTSRASRCPCDHAQLCHYIRACWGAGRWPYLELGRLRWTVFAPQRLVTVSSTSTSRASAGAPVNQDDSDRSHWRAPGHRPQERRGAVDMLTPLRGVTVAQQATPQHASAGCACSDFPRQFSARGKGGESRPAQEAGLRPLQRGC